MKTKKSKPVKKVKVDKIYFVSNKDLGIKKKMDLVCQAVMTSLLLQ